MTFVYVCLLLQRVEVFTRDKQVRLCWICREEETHGCEWYNSMSLSFLRIPSWVFNPNLPVTLNDFSLFSFIYQNCQTNFIVFQQEKWLQQIDEHGFIRAYVYFAISTIWRWITHVWIQSCTLIAHEDCLLEWVKEAQRQPSRIESALKCPQCGTKCVIS